MCDYEASDMSGVLFFHGLESGPFGSKYKSLNSQISVVSPDFQGMGLEERVQVAGSWVSLEKDLILVGSSYGGLVASLVYQNHPEHIFGIIMMAPALHLPESALIKKLPQACVILHGREDDVVPVEASRRLSERLAVNLIEVSDNHRMVNSHGEMLKQLEMMRHLRDSKI
jgi:alpha/beta superfamily hydrolase